MLQCVDSSTIKDFPSSAFTAKLLEMMSSQILSSTLLRLVPTWSVNTQGKTKQKKSPQEKASSFQLLVSFFGCQSSNAHVSSLAWPHSKSPALDLWCSHILLSSAWSFWSTMNSPIGQLYYWPCPRSPLAASLHQFPWVLCSSLPHLCLQVYHPPLLACQHPGSCPQPG